MSNQNETSRTNQPTAKGREVLKAVFNCEYHNASGQLRIDQPVWQFAALDGFGKSAGGIVAGLLNQGFVGVAHYPGEDPVIWITTAGYLAIRDEVGPTPCDDEFAAYEARVEALEAEGLTRSDAQGVADAELLAAEFARQGAEMDAAEEAASVARVVSQGDEVIPVMLDIVAKDAPAAKDTGDWDLRWRDLDRHDREHLRRGNLLRVVWCKDVGSCTWELVLEVHPVTDLTQTGSRVYTWDKSGNKLKCRRTLVVRKLTGEKSETREELNDVYVTYGEVWS